MLSAAPSRHLKSPTVIATRYDDIFGVVENLDRVLRDRRPGHVRQHLAVGDGGVAAIDGQRDGEGRLERRLVEAGKRPARVGRLELRHRVLPQLGLADVEAAQLPVQDAAEPGVDLGGALRERLRDRERRRLIGLVERDRRVLRRGAGADGHLAELELGRVQDHFRRRLGHLDPNGLGALEPLARQVDHEGQVVMRRRDDGRKSLRRRG